MEVKGRVGPCRSLLPINLFSEAELATARHGPNGKPTNPAAPRQLTDGAGHSDAARGPLAGAERREPDPPPLDMPAA